MSDIIKLESSPVYSANKAQMVDMVSNYLEKVAFEGGDPLKDIAICRKYIFLLEELEKGLKEYALEELSTFDREETELLDVSLKKVETPAKFDFSANSNWVAQKKVLDDANIKLKEIEALAKTLKSKTSILDETTGEITEMFPPIKSSSSTIRVSLK
jgi:hypothetical protein